MFGELSNPWWAFILLGIFAGIASGLLGIGGGVIMGPALVLFFTSFDQKTAQGTALAVMIMMAIVGTLRYMQIPGVTLNWAAVTLIVFGAIAGVLIGTALVERLPVDFIRKCFAVLMLAIAIKIFMTKSPSKSQETPNEQTKTIQTFDIP